MPDAISVTSYNPFSWAIAILKKYYFDKILQFKQEKCPSGLKNPSKLVDRKACFVSTHSYDFSSRNSCRLEWKVTSKSWIQHLVSNVAFTVSQNADGRMLILIRKNAAGTFVFTFTGDASATLIPLSGLIVFFWKWQLKVQSIAAIEIQLFIQEGRYSKTVYPKRLIGTHQFCTT